MGSHAFNVLPTISNFLDKIDLQIGNLDLNRCDERTLYIPITLQYKGYKTICDIIYLIDKEELYGAISLNEKYDDARNFFVQHFNYQLLYRDELYLAETLRNSPIFKQQLQTYAEKYPKHMKENFFK